MNLKKNQTNRRKTADKRGLHFGDYTLTNIWEILTPIKDLDFAKDTAIAILTSLCAALFLTQVRQSWINWTPQKVEARDGYKSFKKSFLNSSTSPITAGAAAIAALETLMYIHEDTTDEGALEGLAASYNDEF
jgi:hypothetical protein